MSWCQKDSDLIVSAGKDNRTIVFDATSGAMLGDLHGTFSLLIFIHSRWKLDSRRCLECPESRSSRLGEL